MSKDLSVTLEYMQEVLPKNQSKAVTQETVDNINMLTEETEYGEHFREHMITSASVLAGKESWSIDHDLTAIKFYSLRSMGIGQVDSYAKVFPDRLMDRLAGAGEDKTVLRGEAARYDNSVLVNKIREQSLVPFHLKNQGAAQEALDQLLHLMMNARSDVAKVSAATAVLKETRPPEAQKVELQLGMSDQALEMHEKQNETLREVAINQRKLLEQGYSLDEVQQIQITSTVIEGEVEDDPYDDFEDRQCMRG